MVLKTLPASTKNADFSCRWSFNVEEGCKPLFDCERFDVANSQDCADDYVRGLNPGDT